MALAPLHPFQEANVAFIVKNKRVIIADDPGLGKSRSALQAAALLYDTLSAYSKKIVGFRILVVTGRSGLNVWRAEDAKWTEIGTELIVGSPSVRESKWIGPSIVKVVTYQTLQRDYASIPKIWKSWDVIILDEAHKIRNRKTEAFKTIKQVTKAADYLIMLTGSPASRGNQDFWSYLNLIDSTLFSSYWKFIHQYTDTENGPFGVEIIGNRNTLQLYDMLASNYMRRTSKIQAKLPPKVKAYLPVTMDRAQRRGYNQMYDELLLNLSEYGISRELTTLADFIKIPSRFALMMRLRQWLVCPKLLAPEAPYGAAIEGVCDWFNDQPEDLGSRHVVIFTPFSESIVHISNALQEKCDIDGDHIMVLQGGSGPDHVRNVEQRFRADPTTVVICTIKFAQSFSLETAAAELFVGAEWDPQDNIQAEDRGNRITSVRSHTLIYYVKNDDTIDQRIYEVLDVKSHNTTSLLSLFESTSK